jgi:hypothetical protein
MSPRESAPKQTGGAVRRGARKVGVFKLVEGRRRHLIGPAPPGDGVGEAPARYQTAPPALLRPLAEYEAALEGGF